MIIKLQINKVYDEINQDQRTSEEEAVKLLKNYQQDMELVYLVTAKVAKIMSKTLNRTNKLYNQCVVAEQESLKSKYYPLNRYIYILNTKSDYF